MIYTTNSNFLKRANRHLAAKGNIVVLGDLLFFAVKALVAPLVYLLDVSALNDGRKVRVNVECRYTKYLFMLSVLLNCSWSCSWFPGSNIGASCWFGSIASTISNV